MRLLTAAMISGVLATPLAAQWLQYPTPGIPRTADGKIDLTGLWEAPVDSAAGNIAARNVGDLKPADIQPWVQALVQQRSDNPGRDNPRYKCLPEGPGYSTNGGMKRIIQTPAMIVILYEDLTYRQIFMDGRALESDPNPSWMGYSTGHWDKDTLVVESVGFNARTWLQDGYPHTEALRMTERYRRVDFGHLEIAVTFQDPGAYAKAWTVQARAGLAADTEMLESVCNENAETGQEHWVGKLSDAAKSAAKVAPEILAKYVGVYKGRYLGGDRVIEVTFSGGTLFFAVNGGPRQPVVPLPETSFSGTGLPYEFIRDDHGIATGIVEGHVSGDYKYARQK